MLSSHSGSAICRGTWKLIFINMETLPDTLSFCSCRYLVRLMVHGVCHITGHTHDEDEDWERMQKQEIRLLKMLQHHDPGQK